MSRRGYAIASSAADTMNEAPVPHQVRFLNTSLSTPTHKVCEPFLFISAMVTNASCGNDVFSNRARYTVICRSLILPARLKFSCRPQSHICACTALTYRIYFRRAFPLGCGHILLRRGVCKMLDNGEIIYKQLCKSSGCLTLEMMR